MEFLRIHGQFLGVGTGQQLATRRIGVTHTASQPASHLTDDLPPVGRRAGVERVNALPKQQ